MALWSYVDIDTLRRFYPTEGDIIIKRFPNRTLSAIKSKVRRNNISIGNPWSKDEKELLMSLFPYVGEAATIFLYNRTVEECSDMYWRLST